MASTKRDAPASEYAGEETVTKKTKLITSAASSSLPRKQLLVGLNPADCALDFNIERDGLRGSALHDQGFAYCWSGARANVGITGGKYFFGCKIVNNQEVVMEDTPPDQQNLCRIGISRGDEDVGNLGETRHSFGYGGTGKFSNLGNFIDYGEKFGEGDTILCAVDLESKPACISFFKNGKSFGSATHFDAVSHGVVGVVGSNNKRLDWGAALFPHVLLKNVIVEMEFTPEDGLAPEEGYKPWVSAIDDGNAVIGPTFSDPSECEVMMMVGLPASGKSTWAEKRVKEHPEKRYILLGTNKNLEQMKVPGLLKKFNYAERFEKLIDRANQILNALLPRAAKTPRNYIIDQTNVYKSARRRKLKPFADYRKVAVVVFPTPEELKVRSDKRFKEMGKEVPAEAVEEMLRNYVLPKSKDMLGTDEFFDEVIFTELNRGEAQRCLDDMKYAQSCANSVSTASFSPYSSAHSVQSYGFSSLSPPSMNFDYQTPGQVNSAYLGSAPQGRMGPFPVVNQTNLASAPDAYNYNLNNSGYISHSAYDAYQRPMVESYVTPPYYADNITGFQAPRGLSTYTPPRPLSSYTNPPPVSHGPSPYATSPALTPTYGNVPAIPRLSNTGGFYPPVPGRYN